MSIYRPADGHIQVAAEAMARRHSKTVARRQFAAARRAGLARRHQQKEQHVAQQNTRSPDDPFINGFGYDQAFNGGSWTISRGQDFNLPPSRMAAALRDEFEHRYGALRIRVDGDKIHLRAIPANAPIGPRLP